MPAQGKIYLTVESNFGRGVDAERFRQGVINVLNGAVRHNTDRIFLPLPPDAIRRQGVAWAPCELDEDDRPMEHPIFLEVVGKAMDGRETKVGWNTFEPLLFSSDIDVKREEVILGCKGLGGAPGSGRTPERHFVEALVWDPDFPLVPPVLFRNHHAPVNKPALRGRRTECKRVHKQRWNYWYQRGVSQVDIGDWNDKRYVRFDRRMKDANVHGLDYIRISTHPNGAQLSVMSKGLVPIGIDPHPALWARILAMPAPIRVSH